MYKEDYADEFLDDVKRLKRKDKVLLDRLNPNSVQFT